MIAAALDAAIKAVCPIHGVSIGRRDDKATWRIDFAPEATPEQREAARAVVAAFDPSAVKPPAARDPLAEIDALKTRLAAAEAEVKKLTGSR